MLYRVPPRHFRPGAPPAPSRPEPLRGQVPFRVGLARPLSSQSRHLTARYTGPLRLCSGSASALEHVAFPVTRCLAAAATSVHSVYLFPPIGSLVGEQSNAYRILLRYDRKSRHRRIKKQRRYERLAATSQFRTTETHKSVSSRPLRAGNRRLGGAPSQVGVARTLSSLEPTPYRALNRSALHRGSQLSCGLSLSYGFLLYPH